MCAEIQTNEWAFARSEEQQLAMVMGWGAGTAREKGCLLCSSCMLSTEGLLIFVLVILK